MDPNVHTKMPDNKRTKYIIIVLLAVIVILSYQLYKENQLKKDLVRRKAFLYKKLNQCHADGEKSEAKYSNVRKEKMKLKSDLEDKTDKHEKLSKDYDELQQSFDKKEMELHSLQKSADEGEKQLSELKANYDSAISSVKTVQGKVNETLVVCTKNKEENIQFKEKVEGLMEQLQQCKDDKSQIEKEKNYHSENSQALSSQLKNLHDQQNGQRELSKLTPPNDNSGPYISKPDQNFQTRDRIKETNKFDSIQYTFPPSSVSQPKQESLSHLENSQGLNKMDSITPSQTNSMPNIFNRSVTRNTVLSPLQSRTEQDKDVM